MKKIIAIIALSLCCVCMVMAQGQGTFRAGLRIGPNFSTLYGLQTDGQKIPTLFSAEEKYKMKPGVRAGFPMYCCFQGLNRSKQAFPQGSRQALF